ncbi:Hypothetical protein CAP_8706 [Chondromyces apiculatus DSM 436]|uniref:Uncharacterized protein n=1 Tax=Chondromyces apiculatus DSM 436 TaxID=1192034 RepID=A0A017TE83_9BACT|nr:Hypothetical protein CAP_8706 [Chondromyces apiculatus DSM 436]
MVAALLDQLEGSSSLLYVCLRRFPEQRLDIVPVLGTMPILPRQDLEGDQMTDPRHRNGEILEDVERFCCTDDLGFDPRRSEQEVHQRAAPGMRRRLQAHRREPTRRGLFKYGKDAVAARLERMNKRFRLCIIPDVDAYIHIARGPRLGARAHGNPPDQRPSPAACTEVRRDLPEGCFYRVQPRRGHGTGRPSPSPSSAPGRRWSHATTRSSISSSLSSGCCRRSF